MKLNRLLLAMTAVLAPSPSAFAAEPYVPVPTTPGPVPYAPVGDSGGLYVSIHGGALFVPNTDVEIVPPPTAEFDSNIGYRLGAAVGADLGSLLSIEAELSHGVVGLDEFSQAGVTLPVTGDASLTTVMGNAILGWDVGAVRPYVGFGGGAARVSLNEIDIGGANGVDDTNWTWGAQAFAGADYQLTDMIAVGGRYRFQYVGGTDFDDLDGDPVAIDQISAHSIEGVIKLSFGQ